MPRVAILDCDGEPTADGGDDGGLMGTNAADWLREEGDEPSAWTWVHLRVKNRPEELPRSAEEFDGYVVPGSRAMVTERGAWMEPVSELIRQAHARGLPLVGICFGHQLIADALGGEVETRAGAQPFNCAVDEIELTESAAAAGLGAGPLRLMKGHSQHVVALPPGATLLGSSPSTPIEIFSLGATVLCCQGHPDFGLDLASKAILPAMESAGLVSAERAASVAAAMRPDAPHPVDNDLLKARFRELLQSGSTAPRL